MRHVEGGRGLCGGVSELNRSAGVWRPCVDENVDGERESVCEQMPTNGSRKVQKMDDARS